MIVHQALVGVTPAHLADDCRFFQTLVASNVGHPPLRSNSNDMWKLLVPQTHKKLGNRSFLDAGPWLWNDLPSGLWRPGLSFNSFRQSLKSSSFGNWSALWLNWIYRCYKNKLIYLSTSLRTDVSTYRQLPCRCHAAVRNSDEPTAVHLPVQRAC